MKHISYNFQWPIYPKILHVFIFLWIAQKQLTIAYIVKQTKLKG